MELETAVVIERLLSQARLAIEAGKRQQAAAFMFVAHEKYGAPQEKIAAAVGRCQAWVCRMIQWRRQGFKDDTPFGTASKEGRMWARFRRLTGVRMPGRILRSRYGSRQA